MSSEPKPNPTPLESKLKSKTCLKCKVLESLLDQRKLEQAKLQNEVDKLKALYQAQESELNKFRVNSNVEISEKNRPFRICSDTEAYLLSFASNQNNEFAHKLFDCKDKHQHFSFDDMKLDEIRKHIDHFKDIIYDCLNNLCSTHDFTIRQTWQTRLYNIIEAVYTTRFGEDSMKAIQNAANDIWVKFASEKTELVSLAEIDLPSDFDKKVLLSKVFKPAAYFLNIQTSRDVDLMVKHGKNIVLSSEAKVLKLAVEHVAVIFKMFEGEMMEIAERLCNGKSFKANAKSYERARWKLDEYAAEGKRPSFEYVGDLLRCRAAFPDIKDLARAFREIEKNFEITRVKNKLATSLKNITFNFVYKGIIAEMQLIHGAVEADLEKHQLYEVSRCRTIQELYQVIKGWGGYNNLNNFDIVKGRIIDNRPMMADLVEKERLIPIDAAPECKEGAHFRELRTLEYGIVDAYGEPWDENPGQDKLKAEFFRIYCNHDENGIYDLQCVNQPTEELTLDRIKLNREKDIIKKIRGWYTLEEGKQGITRIEITVENNDVETKHVIGTEEKGECFEIKIPDKFYVVGFGGKKEKVKEGKPRLITLYCWISRLKIFKTSSNGKEYEGEFLDNNYHGDGVYTDGKIIYEGHFEKGDKSGFGTFYYENGDRYAGQWKKNKKGGMGLEYFANGDKYYGNWEMNNRQGEGEQYYFNGDYYEGDWLENKKEGFGTMYYKDSKTKYEGKWKEDLPNGKGNYSDKNLGMVMKGQFSNGINGKGRITYQNGEVYEGEWRNKTQHGIGTFYYLNKDIFEGEWMNGKRKKGIWYYANHEKLEYSEWELNEAKRAKITNKEYVSSRGDYIVKGRGTFYDALGGKFIGNIINCQKEGPGVYVKDDKVFEAVYRAGVIVEGRGIIAYEDGSKYEGNIKDGLPDGKGIITKKDGTIIDGTFKEGKKHGPSIMKWANGHRVNIIWEEDKIIGDIVYQYDNGETYEGRVSNDVTFTPHGKGIFTYVSGEKYDGEWKEGVKHGIGKHITCDGNIFEGQYVNNKIKKGKGIITYKNGDRYEGDISDFLKHGDGVYVTHHGRRYTGKYKNDKILEGMGVFYFTPDFSYEGSFNKGLKDGESICYNLKRGRDYHGYWQLDHPKDGEAIFFYENGDRYEGHWEQSKRQGRGTYFYSNGDFYEGEWNSGFKHGSGIFTYTDGSHAKVVYIEGKCEEREEIDSPRKYSLSRVKTLGDSPDLDMFNDYVSENRRSNLVRSREKSLEVKKEKTDSPVKSMGILEDSVKNNFKRYDEKLTIISQSNKVEESPKEKNAEKKKRDEI